MVLPGHLEGDLGGLRTPGDEIDPGHSRRGEFDDLPGKLDLGFAYKMAYVGKTDLPSLFHHGINDFLNPVPDVDDRGTSRGIEVSLPLAVI
jgi:hypothetical protein